MRFLRGFIAGFIAGGLKIGISIFEWQAFEKVYCALKSETPYVFFQLWKLFKPATYWESKIWLVDVFIGVLFGCLFAILHDSLPGKRVVKGIFFGFIIWAIGEFPGTVKNFMLIPGEMTMLWIITGLINSLIIGVVIALVYELLWPERVIYSTTA
ncbi:hypothetical protein AUJ95_04495 [Candidatus Desantisbacteria bacterium CG2_30_40_21]|uniref:Uncharacterized protein n=5 Tax=unclassified Candidatus Desantisiibacteriota TaxID=3106372 RepID=A0A2M7JEV4_9BACT|nr:MAG: hypothetical protein AUJ95_04495 [Candidatus Desantisbacteria bacterium CG2_30_40_21]PIP40429.1 MAG: hypothetical protein COX18_06765 [Candidatus Desantisbacteria bacterium CG23_combo_of_CG06-09_8_20_14_all_40_23]PIX17919.1 MAG: hypothetical protein COZ71_00745 [Candidatus Desantisbacteria bacterium CG_4_8_14_3_um_filter_40_12]PIY20621.1 MAG: hypothetical protein COZ13_00105 [Candidatus Desantisbacteria bacterium CG_4_10_14_3_um_filter_40_18]PJB29023.1 MAG: hypothetical protein CO110_07